MIRGPKARRRLMLAAVSLGIAAAAVGFSCGFDGEGESPTPEAGADTTPLLEASTIPHFDGGEPSDDTGAPETGPKGTCPTTLEGPMMVHVPRDGGAGFCIDSTEVTNAQYDKFLNASDGGAVEAGVPAGGLPLRCAGLKTFLRMPPQSDGGVTTPVTRIPWCAAYAYCAWANKRLCKNDAYGVADAGEWYEACSNQGTRIYPYGNAPDSGICDDFPGADTVVPVGSLPECVGGVPGLFDMSGNAYEFIDSCDGVGDASSCTARGTYYGTLSSTPGCLEVNPYPVLTTDPAAGFRCCADAK
jgi:formylglycine-generating enzyme required for sulfatase activity